MSTPVNNPPGNPSPITPPAGNQPGTSSNSTGVPGGGSTVSNAQNTIANASSSSSNTNQAQPIPVPPLPIASLITTGAQFNFDLSNAVRIRTNPNQYPYFASTSLTPRNQDVRVDRLGNNIWRVEIANVNAISVPGDPAVAVPSSSNSTGHNATLQSQSAVHFVIEPISGGGNTPVPPATLHPIEQDALTHALNFLTTPNNPVHTAAVDIFDRNLAQTHTVVLWRNNNMVTLIDPSRQQFSDRLFDYMCALPGQQQYDRVRIAGDTVYGSGGNPIGLVTESGILPQQLQQLNPQIQQQLSPNGNARDCIDIALKLIYELEILETKRAGQAISLQDIQDIIKTVTNQPSAYLEKKTSHSNAAGKALMSELSRPTAQNSDPAIRQQELQRRAAIPSHAATSGATKKGPSVAAKKGTNTPVASSSSNTPTAAPSGAGGQQTPSSGNPPPGA